MRTDGVRDSKIVRGMISEGDCGAYRRQGRKSVRGQQQVVVRRHITGSDATLQAIHRELRAPGETLDAIRSLAIVTANRPASLSRALASYVDNAVEHGQDLTFRIIDDSSDKKISKQNIAEIRRIRKKGGPSIIYFGKEQRRAFAKRLILQGAESEAVKFALFNSVGAGFSAGTARNTLLLLTTGELVLSVDDDTVCRIGCVSPHVATLKITSREIPTSVSFYRDKNSLAASLQFVDLSFASIHAVALGRQICEFSSNFSGLRDVEENEISTRLMATLDEGRARILLTQCGCFGGSPFYSLSLLYGLAKQSTTGPNHPKLQFHYHSAMTGAFTRNIAETYTVTDSPSFMCYATGLDNRRGLVPFFPIGRNEDGIFGLLVRVCFGHSLTCHLPYAIVHNRSRRNIHSLRGVWRQADGIRLSDLVLACIRASTVSSSTSSSIERLEGLGECLIEIGSLPALKFSRLVRDQIRLLFAVRINAMEQFLDQEHRYPEFCARHVRRLVEKQRRLLLKEDVPDPVDVQGPWNSSGEHGIRSAIWKYGRLLRAWPTIVEAAMYLTNKKEMGMQVA